MSPTESLIRAYYEAFGRREVEPMLALLTDDVVHDINQGAREVGKAEFRQFMARMNVAYEERILDLVVMATADGTRAAAEFVVEGVYHQSDTGLPPARGQRYRLNAGAFFALREGRIARVTNYYNLQDWLAQVG